MKKSFLWASKEELKSDPSNVGLVQLALPMLLDAMGISQDEVVFFGDAENDLALMGALRNSVAVANATPAAAAAARYHIGRCDEDSVAAALEEIACATREGRTPRFML